MIQFALSITCPKSYEETSVKFFKTFRNSSFLGSVFSQWMQPNSEITSLDIQEQKQHNMFEIC